MGITIYAKKHLTFCYTSILLLDSQKEFPDLLYFS